MSRLLLKTLKNCPVQASELLLLVDYFLLSNLNRLPSRSRYFLVLHITLDGMMGNQKVKGP